RPRRRLLRPGARASSHRPARRPCLRDAGRPLDARGDMGRPDGCGGDRSAGARAEGDITMTTTLILALLIGIALGAGVLALVDRLRRRRVAELETSAHATAARIVEEARKEGEAVRKEAQLHAKDVMIQAKADWEREARDQRHELQTVEKRILQKEEGIDRKIEAFAQREGELAKRDDGLRKLERALEERQGEIGRLTEQVRQKLEEAAGMTRDEAKRTLLEQMTDEARHDAARHIRQVEAEAREEADRRAKKIVSIAIERLAGEFVAERTVSVVTLPSDDMKGRIIGREGRNIRAIEAATGVDLIIDDTPEAVVISCHNPIRRELARLALERLLSDGRIHPGRIEEVVRKAEQELDEAIREAGQRAVLEVGVHGIHPELVKLLGMLKYRYSYAQNVLMHSFKGVEKSFAVQAGREIRIIVDPGTIPDDHAAVLARDIARKIEQEMTYPGQIKVTVIRETRASDIAR